MAWEWRFERADGTAVEPPQDPGDFGTQGDAESWIGESWPELIEAGVDQVTLLDEGNRIYGPMDLHGAADE